MLHSISEERCFYIDELIHSIIVFFYIVLKDRNEVDNEIKSS